MKKGEIKNNKCMECGADGRSPYSGRCRPCYEAAYYNRQSLPQKLISRNFIRNGIGIITDSKGIEHELTIEEFELAKDILWSGGKNKIATNSKGKTLCVFVGRTHKYEKKVKVVLHEEPKKEWSYEYKIVNNLKKYKMSIYMATSPSGKSYIGKTVQSLAKRISGHRVSAQNGKSGKFMAAIRKYGVDNFEWIVLDTTDDYDTLNALECWYIQHYNSIEDGYNIYAGGDIGVFGFALSEATKEKIRQANIGKKRDWTWTKEMYNKNHDSKNKPWIIAFDKDNNIIGYGRNDRSVAKQCGISHATVFNLKIKKHVSKKGITINNISKHELQKLNIAI